MSSLTAPLSAAEVESLAAGLRRASAEEILREAVDRFPGRVVLTCSWQRTSSALIHMIATQSLDVRIVEVDTGLLFPETHAVRERLVQRYGIEVETLRPRRTVDQQASDQGPQLWLREPDRCCAMRKVEPLERALGDADAWVSGLRRSSGGSRSGIQPLSLDEARGVVKVAPLWDWTSEDVEDFVARNRIPVNALHAQSYPSIGCMPCTRPVGNAADERAGRWAFSGKTECGLHYPTSAS